jgi:hypothetical protein
VGELRNLTATWLLLLLLLLQVNLREAAGKRWVDPTLTEWPENDFRIFVGDLGNEVNDDALGKAFQRYPSFAKAKVRFCCCDRMCQSLQSIAIPQFSCQSHMQAPSSAVYVQCNTAGRSIVVYTLVIVMTLTLPDNYCASHCRR